MYLLALLTKRYLAMYLCNDPHAYMERSGADAEKVQASHTSGLRSTPKKSRTLVTFRSCQDLCYTSPRFKPTRENPALVKKGCPRKMKASEVNINLLTIRKFIKKQR